LKDLDTALIHLLSQANPQSEAQTLLQAKARQKTLLLENPAIKPKKSLQKKPKRHAARLASKTSLKKRGLLFNTATSSRNDDDDVITWDVVQPLFQRWRIYLQTILALPTPNNNINNNKSSNKSGASPGSIVAEKLVLLDLHGCLLRIKQSDEARWTGMQGIVIKETLNTIEIVVKEGDRIVRVPKERCVFEFDLDNDGRRVAVLQGSSMMLPSRIF
jgi:RNase P/RNase MRP subunit p29